MSDVIELNFTKSMRAESVRNAFRRTIQSRVGSISEDPILETTLIRGGSFCGRRFALDGFSLVWFVDEQQIKLFDPSGSLVIASSAAEFCAGSSDVPSLPIRRAA